MRDPIRLELWARVGPYIAPHSTRSFLTLPLHRLSFSRTISPALILIDMKGGPEPPDRRTKVKAGVLQTHEDPV
jgi:hypothetical protein